MARFGGIAFALALASGWGDVSSASAQATFSLDEYSAVTFTPAAGSDNYLMVDGARVGGTDGPTFGLWLDYAYRALHIKSFCDVVNEIPCDLNDERVSVAEHLAIAHLTGAYTFADMVEVGVVLPVAYADGEQLQFRTDDGPGEVPGGSGLGLADPTLRVKVGVLDTQPWRAAIVAWGTVPLGQATLDGRYVGDDGVTFGGHVVGEASLMPGLRAAAQLGGLRRPRAKLVGADVGSMLTYGAAVEYDFTNGVSALGEVHGETAFGASIDQLEARLAAGYRFGDFRADVGGGLGLVLGPGVPAFRLLAGLRWQPRPAVDSDGDGVVDAEDACPDLAEDVDGFADEDGCPEPDNDGDGLADADDACPDQPEDVDDYEDDDGCPDEDNDGDGVSDGYDSCPNTPEDMDGDRDDDGCPDADADRDNIPDDRDQCPNEPEDTDGFGDMDGCPEEDFDGDGIPDEEDYCPETPGQDC